MARMSGSGTARSGGIFQIDRRGDAIIEIQCKSLCLTAAGDVLVEADKAEVHTGWSAFRCPLTEAVL